MPGVDFTPLGYLLWWGIYFYFSDVSNYWLLEVSLLTGLWSFTHILFFFVSRFNELSFPEPNICNSLAGLAFCCIIHPMRMRNGVSPNPIPMPVMHGHRSSAWLFAFVSGQNRDANAESESRNIEGCRRRWRGDLQEDETRTTGTPDVCRSRGFDLVESPVRLTLDMSEKLAEIRGDSTFSFSLGIISLNPYPFD